MAWRQIDVDDDVYTFLEEKAQPFVDKTPNDVLRRVLLNGAPALEPSSTAGDLKPLIESGALLPGDKLVHHQPRKGRTFRAVVTAEGFLETTSGRRYKSPSPALKEYVGHDINGWGNWTVERTDEVLQSIRP
jgi:hypothetical protein